MFKLFDNFGDSHHTLPFTTKHEFFVKGLGLISLYVPANVMPLQWAKIVTSVDMHSHVTYPEIVHIRAIA
jgi:hypothetical protein